MKTLFYSAFSFTLMVMSFLALATPALAAGTTNGDVPEPGSLLLLGGGLAAVGVRSYLRRRS